MNIHNQLNVNAFVETERVKNYYTLFVQALASFIRMTWPLLSTVY